MSVFLLDARTVETYPLFPLFVEPELGLALFMADWELVRGVDRLARRVESWNESTSSAHRRPRPPRDHPGPRPQQ